LIRDEYSTGIFLNGETPMPSLRKTARQRRKRMAQDVFVSYSVKDKAVADAIVARLEADSIQCWVAPRDVVPGADWGESIINAIESSRIMILVFTSNANASPQIKREVERAVDKGVYIIPFRVDNIEPTRALEYFISTSQWMDAFAPPLEPHFEHLAKTVKAILKGQPPPVPRPVSPLPIPTAQALPKPPASSARWIGLVVALGIAALAGWYFASRGMDRSALLQTTPTPTPVVVVPQSSPFPTESARKDSAAQEAEEREAREQALKAQLAEAQEKMARMQEAAQKSVPATPSADAGPWIFPDSSSRYLSRAELRSLAPEQLWQARNEIYARNGYRFSTPRGVAFAQSLGRYYRGIDPDDDRGFNRMNPYEQANVNLIRSMEQR
jgi:hypothetical protein